MIIDVSSYRHEDSFSLVSTLWYMRLKLTLFCWHVIDNLDKFSPMDQSTRNAPRVGPAEQLAWTCILSCGKTMVGKSRLVVGYPRPKPKSTKTNRENVPGALDRSHCPRCLPNEAAYQQDVTIDYGRWPHIWLNGNCSSHAGETSDDIIAASRQASERLRIFVSFEPRL